MCQTLCYELGDGDEQDRYFSHPLGTCSPMRHKDRLTSNSKSLIRVMYGKTYSSHPPP